MKKQRKENSFIKKPSYKGGREALKQFIGANLKYPQEAYDNKIEGTVKIKYTINHRGDVIKTKVISKLGFGCDEEACRVVRLLKFHVERARGIKVLHHKDINVHFHMPKQKIVENKPKEKQEIPTEISYEITSKPKKKETGGGYTITINYD